MPVKYWTDVSESALYRSMGQMSCGMNKKDEQNKRRI